MFCEIKAVISANSGGDIVQKDVPENGGEDILDPVVSEQIRLLGDAKHRIRLILSDKKIGRNISRRLNTSQIFSFSFKAFIHFYFNIARINYIWSSTGNN